MDDFLFFNAILGIFIPLMIPIFNVFCLRKDNKEFENMKLGRRLLKYFSDFTWELPSAFIGNSIWGISYRTEKIIDETWWFGFFFLSIFFSISFYVAERNRPHTNLLFILIWIYEILLVFFIILRVLLYSY